MPSPSLPIAENRQMSVVVPCYDLRDACLFRPDNPVTSKNSSARSVLLAVAVATAGVVPAFLTGGLAVQIRAEFGFGEGALGLAVAVFFAVSALASVASGRLVERVGSFLGMRLAAAVSAVSLLAVSALAGSWWGARRLPGDWWSGQLAFPPRDAPLSRPKGWGGASGIGLRRLAGGHTSGYPARRPCRSLHRHDRWLALGLRRLRRPCPLRRPARARRRRGRPPSRQGGASRRRTPHAAYPAGFGYRAWIGGGQPSGRLHRRVGGFRRYRSGRGRSAPGPGERRRRRRPRCSRPPRRQNEQRAPAPRRRDARGRSCGVRTARERCHSLAGARGSTRLRRRMGLAWSL